ncbi:two component transcriptional regulator, LuxR family [Sphingopyxis sp. YR583]|jgi:FixJ family two-component response regulator|uniref:response regulator transcription factor n=1 Tax=Sphingopyxis sp. YR583 TaxID=1881047 RepID=UPI0008A75B83|nr:response regulator [Sphingopyxis sp. YR583]SEH18245.1 two component transcriptional regulator, LuxR family [Sphingopyxis sp. YR583]
MTDEALVHVIDDDPGMRGALGSLLRSAGFEVALHASTDGFRDAVTVDIPSCLVLDIRLRGENGLDFQDWLAAERYEIPVILITGHGDIPMTVRGMKAGAIDFLPKPFSDEQMLDAVANGIAKSRERLEAGVEIARLKQGYAKLTPREAEVMSLVVTGLMNKQVAARLDLSEITVKIHRGNVMKKMEAQSLADLVRMAEQLGVRDESIHRFNI